MDYQVDRLAQGAVFTIARVTQLNALNHAVWEGLECCLDELESEGGRFLVITGQGDRAFSAGSDLKADVLANWDQQSAKCDRIRSLLLRLSRSRLFTIAALNGMAHGGGLELALACTLRIAVAHFQCSMPEIRLGVIPSYGGTQFLPAIVGRARAAELMLTGRVLSAAEAKEWGLVSHVLDDSQGLMNRAMEIADEVSGFSLDAYCSILECLAAADAAPAMGGMDVESQQLAHLLDRPGAQEGIRAFLKGHSKSS